MAQENNTSEQDKKQYSWLRPFQFKPGQSGNPKGKNKGKTMKHYASDYLQKMTKKERLEFMTKIGPQEVWRMAEGNPHQTKDITTAGKPIGTILDEIDGK